MMLRHLLLRKHLPQIKLSACPVVGRLLLHPTLERHEHKRCAAKQRLLLYIYSDEFCCWQRLKEDWFRLQCLSFRDFQKSVLKSHDDIMLLARISSCYDNFEDWYCPTKWKIKVYILINKKTKFNFKSSFLHLSFECQFIWWSSWVYLISAHRTIDRSYPLRIRKFKRRVWDVLNKVNMNVIVQCLLSAKSD